MALRIPKLLHSPWPVITIALIFRLLYLISYKDSPFFQIPIWDAEEYHNMALILSKGAIPMDLPFRPPLYPFLLSTVYIMFGSGMLLPRLIQIVIGVWSCVLVQRIGNRLFNATAGMIAGFAAALSGLMIYFDLELLPTTFVVFFSLLLIYELLKVGSGHGSPVRAGVWFGLTVLTRPVLLPFLPFAAWWIWNVRKTSGGNANHRTKQSVINAAATGEGDNRIFPTRSIGGKKGEGIAQKPLLFVLSGITPLLISLILHLSIGSGQVLVSAQGGVNFYIGNHRESDGITARFPGLGAGWNWETVRNWAESSAHKTLSAAEIDRFYWRVGFNEIQADLSGFISRTMRKAVLFWNRIEISSNRDLYYHGRCFPLIGVLMWIGFPVALPLALVGLYSGWQLKGVRLLGLFVLVYFLSVMPFFVNARFRHPLTPIIFILTSGGIITLIDLIKQKKAIRKWVGMTIAFVIGIILPFLAQSGVDPDRWDYGLFTEGIVFERIGRVAEAEEVYRRSLEHNPRAPFVNFKLAELARDRGDLIDAADLYRKELSLQPKFAKAWNNLGVTWVDLGEEEQALSCFMRAIQALPTLREAASNAARIWARNGMKAIEKDNWQLAQVCAERACEYEPGNPLYRTLALETQIMAGDTVGVREALDDLILKNPSFQPAYDLRYNLETKYRK